MCRYIYTGERPSLDWRNIESAYEFKYWLILANEYDLTQLTEAKLLQELNIGPHISVHTLAYFLHFSKESKIWQLVTTVDIWVTKNLAAIFSDENLPQLKKPQVSQALPCMNRL